MGTQPEAGVRALTLLLLLQWMDTFHSRIFVMSLLLLSPSVDFKSTIGWWMSTPNTFRYLPIITMIIWTNLPQIESIDESRDDFGHRITCDTCQRSSWSIPTHQETNLVQQENSHTIEQERYTGWWLQFSADIREPAITRSCYPECVNSRWKPKEIKRSYTSQLSYISYDQIQLRLHSTRQPNRQERTYGGEPAQSKLTSGREEG